MICLRGHVDRLVLNCGRVYLYKSWRGLSIPEVMLDCHMQVVQVCAESFGCRAELCVEEDK